MIVREIAYEEGMKHTEIFERFMSERFPSERDPYYVAEWARRFMSGNPIVYMDGPSKAIYLRLLQD